MDYAAPKGTIEVLQALFYLCAAGLCIAGMIRLLKGKSPAPPNEVLGLSSDEITRRVTHLESENKQVWEKMERDRMEWKDAITEIKQTIGGLSKENELANQRIMSFDNKLDRLLSRK